MAQHSTITGNLTRDAEEVMLGQTPALKFTIASKPSRKDKKTGNYETEFVDCVLFRTGLKSYLTKGARFTVGGEVIHLPWITKDGQPRPGTQMTVDWVEFGSSNAEDSPQTAQNAPQSTNAPRVGNLSTQGARMQQTQNSGEITDYNDQLPF